MAGRQADILEHRIEPTGPDIDTLVENLPGNVYRRVRKPNGLYLFEYLSSGLFRQFGIDPERLLNQRPVRFDWIHPDDRQRMIADLELSAATLGLLDHRVRVVGSEQRVHWARGIARPTRRPDGSVVWDGIVIDVTREIEAEMALRVAKDEADRARRTAADAVSAAFDRLREPIGDLARLLQRPTSAETESQRPALKEILDAFRNAVTAAPAWGSQPLVTSPRALTRRQREVLALMQQGHSNKAIAQKLDITPGTVKLHAAAVLRALNVKARRELRAQSPTTRLE